MSLFVDLTDEETAEFTALTKQALHALDKASAPMGYNLGMNQGAVAGAGVAAHLHQHVVPRWGGDSNFLPIVARTKALPMLLEDVRTRLVEAWPRSSKFERRCFELLRQAYVNARYSPHYEISANELAWLSERVTALQELVRRVCEERLAR